MVPVSYIRFQVVADFLFSYVPFTTFQVPARLTSLSSDVALECTSASPFPWPTSPSIHDPRRLFADPNWKDYRPTSHGVFGRPAKRHSSQGRGQAAQTHIRSPCLAALASRWLDTCVYILSSTLHRGSSTARTYCCKVIRARLNGSNVFICSGQVRLADFRLSSLVPFWSASLVNTAFQHFQYGLETPPRQSSRLRPRPMRVTYVLNCKAC